jgi:hypothetical protein
MIHWTPEGQIAKIGLNCYINFSLTRFWFLFKWHWFEPSTEESFIYYFRFRLFQRPFIIKRKDTYNRITSFLFERDLYLMTHEEKEDLLSLKNKNNIGTS